MALKEKKISGYGSGSVEDVMSVDQVAKEADFTTFFTCTKIK